MATPFYKSTGIITLWGQVFPIQIGSENPFFLPTIFFFLTKFSEEGINFFLEFYHPQFSFNHGAVH